MNDNVFKLVLDIEKAKASVKSNGGKVTERVSRYNGTTELFISIEKPGLKVLGPLDFLLSHGYKRL
jgi:hypothetical protein